MRLANPPSSGEARLLGALAALPIGIALVERSADSTLRVVEANPAYFELTDGGGGPTLCERLYLPDRTTAISPSDWPPALALASARALDDCELHLHLAGEEWRILSLSVALVPGEPNAVVLSVRREPASVNLGRLNRVEAELQRSRNELQMVIEKLPIGIFFSRGGRFLYANPTFCHYLGYERAEQLIGQTAEAILSTEDLQAGLAYALPQEAPFRSMPAREWSARHVSGRIVTVRTEPTREITLDGERAILWMVTDLTALREMQAQLLSADRLASLGMLSAAVAHEVNNPLTFLLGALELAYERLDKATITPDDQKVIASAVAEARLGAERVRGVVGELKHFSRDDGKLAAVDVKKLINAAVHITANEVRPRARVVTDFGSIPSVLASEVQLSQVFLNLIINAAQAIPEGRAADHEIRITTSTDGRGRCVIEVRDTGVGMSASVLERIFDPFYTTKPVGIGTGLGLAICRNTVHALGGEISVASEVGRGTVFRIILPPATVERTPTSRGMPRLNLEPPSSRRGRVLVVDDELSIGQYVERALAIEHDVTVMTRAREARDRIAGGERFDAIICDLMMPEMTGMDFFAELQAMAPDQTAQIILLTGGAFTPRASAFLESVPNHRLFKPFSAVDLRELVRVVVG